MYVGCVGVLKYRTESVSGLGEGVQDIGELLTGSPTYSASRHLMGVPTPDAPRFSRR